MTITQARIMAERVQLGVVHKEERDSLSATVKVARRTILEKNDAYYKLDISYKELFGSHTSMEMAFEKSEHENKIIIKENKRLKKQNLGLKIVSAAIGAALLYSLAP